MAVLGVTGMRLIEQALAGSDDGGGTTAVHVDGMQACEALILEVLALRCRDATHRPAGA